jgi:hypothetical protein
VECSCIVPSDVCHGFVFDHCDERVDRPALDFCPLLSLSFGFASNLIGDNFVAINVERLADADLGTCSPPMSAVETMAGVPLPMIAVTRWTISSTGRRASSLAGR